MNESQSTPQTIDEYITGFPEEIQETLQAIRQAIHEAAPEATEAISYQMPTFKLNGNLVHFGAFKQHIGFYPTPSGTEHFQAELAPYTSSKGAIQFPLEEPIPYRLITEIVKFRVTENEAKAVAKKKSAGS
ncbi:MAG: DUF1801 domain-containing protein [Chloroflexota bacterium]|jgi:uncharacterized protein YdhG (YjbR/CyaY superfamily)